jgi:hypothetical protein
VKDGTIVANVSNGVDAKNRIVHLSTKSGKLPRFLRLSNIPAAIINQNASVVYLFKSPFQIVPIGA